ncbi:hypothetical protein Tco_1025245 [Tanacetum coccineum]
MGKQSFTTDAKGWTWIFRNNKNLNLKNIDNHYNKDLERIATSFYVSNLPESLDAKGNASVSQPVNRPPAKNENPKTESIPKPESNPNFSYHQSLTTKPSFANVIDNKQKPSTTTHTPDTVRTVNLIDNDLITIEDSSTVLLGLWIWIQFSSSLSCSKFRENANMKSLYSSIRTPSPFFKVGERMIWIEISGLPLCAWGSNAFKKVASLFGKFKFFEDEESTAMSSGRVCISTSDSSSHLDVNHLDKEDISVGDKLDDDLDNLNGMLNDLNQATKKEETPFESPYDINTDQPLK